MYERFTDRSRKIIQLANQAAKDFHHEYIGTEHILIGLVKEGSGIAANVLKDLGVSLKKIQDEINAIVQPSKEIGYSVCCSLPQTPRTKKIIEYAIEEARNLGHNYVGTEHLLLGLLREGEGIAATILSNLGLKIDDARKEIMGLLGKNVDGTPLKDDDYEIIVKKIKKIIGDHNMSAIAEITELLKNVE